MSDKNYRKVMDREIQKRLASSDWSACMAEAVISRRTARSRKLITAALASSLPAAALIAVVFMFGINRRPAPVTYSQFITTQVQGTYQSVFAGVPESNTLMQAHEEILRAGDIDSVINDALMNR